MSRSPSRRHAQANFRRVPPLACLRRIPVRHDDLHGSCRCGKTVSSGSQRLSGAEERGNDVLDTTRLFDALSRGTDITCLLDTVSQDGTLHYEGVVNAIEPSGSSTNLRASLLRCGNSALVSGKRVVWLRQIPASLAYSVRLTLPWQTSICRRKMG